MRVWPRHRAGTQQQKSANGGLAGKEPANSSGPTSSPVGAWRYTILPGIKKSPKRAMGEVFEICRSVAGPMYDNTFERFTLPKPPHNLNEQITASSTRLVRRNTSSTANSASGSSAATAATPRMISRCISERETAGLDRPGVSTTSISRSSATSLSTGTQM